VDKRAIELRLVEDGGAYYFIPGTLVRVIQDVHRNGLSKILLGGLLKPLWTYTRFLSARPIRDTYGILETPDTDALIDPGDAAIAWKTGECTLNGRMPARTQ
jgi:hypothetical protein